MLQTLVQGPALDQPAWPELEDGQPRTEPMHDRAPAAQLAANNLPTMLIFDPDGRSAQHLAGVMQHRGTPVRTVVVERRVPSHVLDRHGAEIAAIRLCSGAEGLVFAVDLSRAQPWVQIVFWTEGGHDAPEVAAAHSLGITRVLGLAQLASWFAVALAPLARYARARREMLAAQALVPDPPPCATPQPTTLSLPEAERRFREAYLRRVLSESSSHREAAVRAGVPYTTLCSMVNKLGL
jgi:hypothetical protein